jgi:hypothetical protein
VIAHLTTCVTTTYDHSAMTLNQRSERDEGVVGDCIEVGTSWTSISNTGKIATGLLPAVRKGGPSQWLPAKNNNAPKRKGDYKGNRCSLIKSLSTDSRQAKSITPHTPAKRLKPVQDVLKPLVKEHLPFQAPGITTEEIYQNVMANPAQATEWANPDTLRVHIRTILKHMHDSGEALREAAKGDNGGSTFVYTRSPSFQVEPFPPTQTPYMRSSPTTVTHAHEAAVKYASGSPANFGHLLWRPEEELRLVTPVVDSREVNAGGQDLSQPSASDQSLTEPEPMIRVSDRPGSELLREHDGSSIGGEDSDKADMELLKTARRLRVEMELATNDLSMSEFQMQQAQEKCLTLERQASEQRSKEAELLAHAQRLREEILKTESEAAECQKGADRLDKEADDERNSGKEVETIIAATKERATEIKEKLQKIREELKI